MKSEFSVSFERRLSAFLLLLFLLPLQSTAERRNASSSYNELIHSNNRNILPWHRLEACPSDSDNFKPDDSDPNNCVRQPAKSDPTRVEYKCKNFIQYCFSKTMELHCDLYERVCTERVNCRERYENCRTKIRNETYLVTKAPSPGIPAPVYAECIPVVDALRDQCNSSFTCSSTFKYDPATDDLVECAIDCSLPLPDATVGATFMQCYNYTRQCEFEKSEVVNTAIKQSVKIIDAQCDLITKERRLDKHMVWSDDVIAFTEEGTPILSGAIIINRTEYLEWTQDESWEQCTESTQVPYEPICNLFIRHMMEPLKNVVYEPRAYDLNEGIKKFLSLWDDGYKILCGVKANCFIHLVKFSRGCWPGLPLQRFLPGADYASVESLLKNMTRIACTTTPPPPVKFKGDQAYLNARNSCASFFDVEHPITSPYYANVTRDCDESEGGGMCTPECNVALDGLALRFGCCLGSIVYEYGVSNKWYAHFNYANNELIRKLETCGTLIGLRCELIDPSSIVVTIVRNFIYILGAIMALVVIMMTVSFYWQLEHEPIKKAFYHF